MNGWALLKYEKLKTQFLFYSCQVEKVSKEIIKLKVEYPDIDQYVFVDERDDSWKVEDSSDSLPEIKGYEECNMGYFFSSGGKKKNKPNPILNQ